MRDAATIKANGPWALCKVIEAEREDGMQKVGSLFIPDGTMEERTGYSKAKVLSVGEGYWTHSLKLDKEATKKRNRFVPPDFKAGDVILHRGWLSDIQKPSPLDREHFFIHVKDVEGVFEG